MWSKLIMVVLMSGFGQLSVATAEEGGDRTRSADGKRIYRESKSEAGEVRRGDGEHRHGDGEHHNQCEHHGDDDGDCSTSVQALFGLDKTTDGPFPADRFTMPDTAQNTCERVNLPKPVCAANSWECTELDLVNALDGFNLRPRIAIPFSGPIDLSTVDSTTIFLVSLGSSLVDGVPSCLVPPAIDKEEEGEHDDDEILPPADAGWMVGINRAVWDPITNTLYVEADELLNQHTRYAVIVTRGLKDSSGAAIQPSKEFKHALEGDNENDHDDHFVPVDPVAQAYKKTLRHAVSEVRFFGVRRHDIATASVFTTMSVTYWMERVRAQIAAAPAPARANFNLGPAGARTLFNLSEMTGLTLNRQVTLNGPLSPTSLTTRLPVLRLVSGAIKQVAWGSYSSPSYLLADGSLPNIATYSGSPVVQKYENLVFNVTVPSGTKPANGWPVVIFGHGTNDNMEGAPFAAASKFAASGLATVGFNLFGHSFGPKSTLTVTRTNGGALTFPAGGRAIDRDGDGTFTNPEGWMAIGDHTIILARHGSRQSVADVAQLMRVIQAGVDIDGDGTIDLDGSRIYYAGFSAGSAVGIMLAAVEPNVRATALAGITGWPAPWESPVSRAAVGAALRDRVPSLLNPAGAPLITSLGGVAVGAPFFNENLPARNVPPVVNNVDGALALQDWFERVEWLSNTGAAGAFAPYVRMTPIAGISARPLLFLVARGDQNVPNTSTADLMRAGLLADRMTLYRHDLFNDRALFKNPHSVLIRTDNTVMLDVAKLAQDEVAAFFKSGGASTIDPDGAAPLFEVPAATVPETTGFIP